MQNSQVDMLHDIQRLLSIMSLEQSALTTTALETQRTIEAINGTASSLNASCAQITEIASETYTTVNRVIDQTLDTRNMTRKIKGVSKELVEETLSGRPRLIQAFGKELERTISKTVRHHLREARPGQITKINQRYAPVDNRHLYNRERIRFGSGTAPPHVGQQRIHSLQHCPDHPADCWIKKSSIASQRELIRNRLFGTISIGTTTTSYYRKSSEGLETDRKDVSHTTIILLPAPWLFAMGATLSYKNWRLLGANRQPSPYWCLRTVNVVPEDSDIFLACTRHDLAAIRTLFEDCRASPFDVDATGRNLLGFVALGARVSSWYFCFVPAYKRHSLTRKTFLE